MELATTLKSQTVQNQVREVGINPNHWYGVGWADRLRAGQIMPVVIWQQRIAVYRDETGELHALEDVCPHKGVALHKGQVQGRHLACGYHGWEFDGSGQCVSIPYLPPSQKLPCAQARSYAIAEKYNVIWIFPGDAGEAANYPLPDMPEFDDPQWLMVPVSAYFRAHFSMCNENSMDVFHGYLHRNLQGWFDPVLLSLRETESAVCAEYKVSYKSRMAKFLGLTDKGNEVTTRVVSTHYRYPNFYSSLEGVSTLYLMRLPVGPTESRSCALFFFKIPLPQWLLNPLKPILSPLLQRFFLLKFLAQDIEMVESEQQTYLANPRRRYVEINPAIIAVQRLIVRQYEQFVQKSSQQKNNANGNSKESVPLSKGMASGQAELTKETSIG